jgi:hypothetical protein
MMPTEAMGLAAYLQRDPQQQRPAAVDGASILSNLAIDRSSHEEIIENRAVPLLVGMLGSTEEWTTAGKKHAAVGLARLAADDQARQLIACWC